MSFNMILWENRDGQLVALPKHRLDEEERLEEWIAADASLLGLEVLIIGRQVRTPFAGRVDLLAVDQKGDLLILELKRGRTPREVVNPDLCDWVVGVRWHKSFPRDEARRFTGAFANQNVVSKLRDQRTVEFLRREFNVTD